ncbi:type II toxin-antitoxin system VapC family toxin [Thiothrix sp.]|uniref:type II toxin-antitoxin system VapC family toxin n=1 Tax=Thiothrix sp. TaxID=1032 RepID=UPI0025809B62|nr:type II toxin-antitoxin system VapC family toxin [Thiothrix sp.]
MSHTPICIVDASVLLKWLLPSEQEDYLEQAFVLRDALVRGEIDVVVPALWRFEVGNTLCRLMPDYAQELLALCADLGLQEVKNEAWIQEAVRLATNYPVTFYDASYHAVAKLLGGVLVTADKRHVDKVIAEGHITYLADWIGVS